MKPIVSVTAHVRLVASTMADTVFVPLSALDLLPPRLYIKFAIYLSLNSQQDAAVACDHLLAAFVETSRQLPFLSGKVYQRSDGNARTVPGQLEIRYFAKEADRDISHLTRFRDLSTTLDYATFRANGFPDSTLDSSMILPAPLMPDVRQGADVWTAQTTLIKGGVIVAAGLHHSTADGTGMVAIMKRFADNCRRMQERTKMEPFSSISQKVADRTCIEAAWRHEGCATAVSTGLHIDDLYAILGLEPPEQQQLKQLGEPAAAFAEGPFQFFRRWMWALWLTLVAGLTCWIQQVAEILTLIRLSVGVLAASVVPSLAMQTGIFYIPAKGLGRLKKDAAAEAMAMPSVDAAYLTANDALMALLWSAIMRARFPQGGAAPGAPSARLDCTLDARDKLSSSLPPGYVGNVVLMSPTILPLARVTSPATSTGELASIIRKDLDGVTAKRAQAAFSVAASMDNYANLKFGFMDPTVPSTMITSMLMAPFAEYDFGPVFGNNGRPESLRTIMADFNKVTRMCFVLPRKRHGGIEVVITLQRAEMERLKADERFAKYASFLCH